MAQSSRVQVLHAGEALDPVLSKAVREEMRRNPRYRWLGPLPRRAALCLLSEAKIALSTSRVEGGANAIGEALALGVPVLATRIAGNVGLLGPDYPGLYTSGAPLELQKLLELSETSEHFYSDLCRAARARAPLFHRSKEVSAWVELLAELEEATC